jgi:hypothetical protein
LSVSILSANASTSASNSARLRFSSSSTLISTNPAIEAGEYQTNRIRSGVFATKCSNGGRGLRILVKPDAYSILKPDTCSNFIPAGVPI